MLSKINTPLKKWISIISIGNIIGTIYFFLIDILPSKFADILLQLFGLEYMVAALFANYIDSGSFAYWIFTVIHFSFLSWLFLWLINKHLSVKQWLLTIVGYLLFSMTVFYISAYIFFHFIVQIGGKV